MLKEASKNVKMNSLNNNFNVYGFILVKVIVGVQGRL